LNSKTISEPVSQARTAAVKSVVFGVDFHGEKQERNKTIFSTRLVADLPTPLDWLNRQEFQVIFRRKIYHATITANAQVTMSMISP